MTLSTRPDMMFPADDMPSGTCLLMDFHGQILSVSMDRHVQATSILSHSRPLLFDLRHSCLEFQAEKVCLYTKEDRIFIAPRDMSCLQIQQEGRFIFLSNGPTYISSNPDGRVDLKNNRENWEKFFLLPYDGFVFLRCMMENGFHSGSLGQFFNAGKCIVKKFHVRYADISFSLEQNSHISFHDSTITYGNISIDQITVLNPAIYFCVFGKPEFLDMFILCARSIMKRSNVNFTFIIITDLDIDDVMEATAFIIKKKIIPAHFLSKMEYLYARFTITRFDKLSSYQPVIYSDIDVICNASLKSLVETALLNENILVNTEQGKEGQDIWFGGEFISTDPYLEDRQALSVNSGLFCFNNIRSVIPLFQTTLRICHAAYTKWGHDLKAYDQPCFNYALKKMGRFDLTALSAYVVNFSDGNFDAMETRGLAHFCGGVGVFSSKYKLMSEYAKYLEIS